ncbi:CBO0543 family protein [Desulforamulus aquiferis]|uniref:Rod shape-determining protein MreD n=1 Tax=Desulforamulus aquiferis TaxID=1397668 RepID=A0AAW7ZH37_9FIRM|nr:CBO0543 family protein [Desulforamulus aquiferis]MDO7788602.1 hypothetical protein [Desulforamulus aquiferis]RYD04205.1 hypothetical protein N752_15280 [Desulforamulus aquiferis]
MPWLIAGVISWIIFYILVDFKQLRRTVYAGLFASLMATFVDWGGQRLGFYRFDEMLLPIANAPIFYIFGPVFVVGVLFAQHLPRNKSLQIVNIFIVSLLYLSLEYLLIQTNAARHLNWHLLASFSVNLAAFTILTYVIRMFNLSPKFDSLFRL